ncbi:MAG: hypothetical protein JRF40_12150 [Deltaproteobacteria bacterium]|nr:hypothetical protein [Deltaproteobacteria bacterium]
MQNKHRILLAVFILLSCLAAAGCRPAQIAVKPEPPEEAPAEPLKTDPMEADPMVTAPSSRTRAARALNLKAASLLENHKPDAAIDLLERSIAIDSSNGQAYYYFSNAWLMKGDQKQAYEFNRLAEEYVEDDDEWRRRVLEQKSLIQEP